MFHMSFLSSTNRPHEGLLVSVAKPQGNKEDLINKGANEIIIAHTELIKHSLMIKGAGVREANKSPNLMKLSTT